MSLQEAMNIRVEAKRIESKMYSLYKDFGENRIHFDCRDLDEISQCLSAMKITIDSFRELLNTQDHNRERDERRLENK